MSEVYVVKYNVQYEGYGIAGIYTTESAAIARASGLKPTYNDYVTVQPYTLNKKKKWYRSRDEIWHSP